MEPCLDVDMVVELVEGRANEATRTQIESHVSRCNECRVTLSALMRGDDPPRTQPEPIGRYRILRELGSGGMGVVYAAHDPELDRTVALKVLRDDRSVELESRLRREAQAMAKLAHPNIAAVHDVGAFGDRIFIAMEYVEGETLATWSERGRDAEQVLDIYREAGRGLAAAHAAGLVHRDFKPENVMVGKDGRTRVVDFGLAQSADVRERSSPVASTTTLTATGTILGTPFYMAPELFDGHPADARSDQFSFCVALAVSLTGARPFREDGWERKELLGIPRHARRTLRRGLAIDPADRFATMDDLLASMARPRRRWPWIAAAVPSALAFGIVAWPSHAPPVCTGGEARLRGVWDVPRKLAVERAMLEVKVPYAATTWTQTRTIADRYANDWRAMQLDTCEATRVRGEASETVLDLRMTCLDERLRSLEALSTALIGADRIAMAHAVAAAQDLPAIDDCANRVALEKGVRPPSVAIRSQVDALRRQVASVRSARELGNYKRGLTELSPVLDVIRSLGYRPLEAEALALDATLASDTSQFARARTSFESAILAAEAGRDDQTAATAAIAQLTVVGVGLGRPKEIGPLHERAAALLERLNQPPELGAKLLLATGDIEIATGKLDDAERDLVSALAIAERTHGRTDIRLVTILRTLARLEILRIRTEPARGYLDRALAIQKRVLGDTHPDLASTLMAIGGMQYMALQNDEALASYRAAQTIYERAFGADSAAVANVLDNIALVYEWQGKADEAIVLHRRAIEIDVRALGAEHPTTIAHRSALAMALEDEDHSDEAFHILTEILGQERAQLGPDHQQIGATLGALALTELSLKKYDAALAHAGEARAMLARVLGSTYRPVSELTTMGRALLGLDRAREAATTLTEARAAVNDTIDDGTIVLLDSWLGEALVASGTDVQRGRELVLASWHKIAADSRMTENLVALEQWMEAHGISVPHR